MSFISYQSPAVLYPKAAKIEAIRQKQELKLVKQIKPIWTDSRYANR